VIKELAEEYSVGLLFGRGGCGVVRVLAVAGLRLASGLANAHDFGHNAGDIGRGEEDRHVVLVLRAVRPAPERVAAIPRGAEESWFFNGHLYVSRLSLACIVALSQPEANCAEAH
jgi:hypothetical protein